MKEKEEPTGSMIYLLHTHFGDNTYSFVGNRQTFGDLRTMRSHLEDLSFMFIPPVYEFGDSDAFGFEYYVRQLQVYPGVLNIKHQDQTFLNGEKKKYIKQFNKVHYLNNIALNDDSNALVAFMKYNRDMKKEIMKWERHDATLDDICELAQWLQTVDISRINRFPRFFWFDSMYVEKVKSQGLYPSGQDVLMALMAFKNNLGNNEFVERLMRFGLYKQYGSPMVIDKLKEWKIGSYYKSPKKKCYTDSLDYASKYMYGFCKRERQSTEYKLEKMHMR